MPESSNRFIARAKARALRRGDTQPDATVVEPAQPRARWRDLWTAFIAPSRSQAIVAVILFVSGLLLVMGFNSSGADDEFKTMRRSDLIGVLDTLSADNNKLQSEINRLAQTKRKLESGADSAKVATEEANRRLAAVRILAGVAPAYGPGIQVNIADPNRKVSVTVLLDAIEELRDAGAEVIEINNKIRLVMNSWVSAASDGGLLVDGQPVTFPMTIEAIGDPATLSSAMKFRGGLVSQVQSKKIDGTVTISQVESIRITSVVTAAKPQYSRPA